MVTRSLRVILALLLAIFLVGLSPSSSTIAAATRGEPIGKALYWLRSQQQADGSIPSLFDPYNGTSKAVLAIAAGNQDPHTWLSSDNRSPLDFLASQVITQTDTITETGTTAWLTLAVAAASENPYDFGGVDLVATLTITDYDPATGQYGLSGDVPAQALSMMAVRAAGQTVPVMATELLKSWQDDSGGWGWAYPCTGWCSPDVDNTALVMQALIVAGEPITSTSIISATEFLRSQQGASTSIISATEFLRSQQGGDGGFQSWGMSNANSTAWGIQAILALGQDPAGVGWAKDGHTPADYLLSL